jgi:hypothetical protein
MNEDSLPGTGAIRMMAFGVFEEPNTGFNFGALARTRGQSWRAVEDAGRPEERLVLNEFEALGWLLRIDRSRHGRGAFVLLGPQSTKSGWATRVLIGRGTLQEVCAKAVRYLDEGPGYREQLEQRSFTTVLDAPNEGESE